MALPQPSSIAGPHGLGVVRTMPEFRTFVDTQTPLTQEQRTVLVEQARVLIEDLYVNLPLKRAMHTCDPVQRLRLLAHRMSTLNDREFHAELLDIFLSLRDLHTNYSLPKPFAGRIAFLGVLIERFTEAGVSRWLVTKKFDHLVTEPSLQPGVTVTHWNGAPIELAIWRHAQREAGSNLAARAARGLESLTLRSMTGSLPPDEDWVELRYEADGQVHEARLMWQVFDSVAEILGGSTEPTGMLAGLTTPISHLIGLDLRTELSRRTKKLLFAPAAVEEELRANQWTASALPPTEQQLADNVITTNRPDDLTAKIVETTHGKFGYLRLWTFFMKDGQIGQFVGEVLRLLEAEFPPAGLIIDVRGNGGGYVIAAEFLLQFLTPRQVQPEPAQFVNTPDTLQLCTVVPDMEPWRASIAQATETGAQYSVGISLSEAELVNVVGQVYHGPVVLITDALCYSACDMFAAGFADHEIGEIIGVDANTGAGGANVLEHADLLEAWTDGPLAALPAGAAMRVSLRRTLRVGDSAGQPVEDLGVVPDVIHGITRDDLLHGNRDLIEAAAKILADGTPRVLKAEVIAPQGGTPQDNTVALRLTTTAVATVDVYVNDRPQLSGVSTASGSTEVTVELPTTGEAKVRIDGFADGKLVGNRKLTFNSSPDR